MIDLLSKAGGLFALLAFNHFLVDWVFQTHWEAMNKGKNGWIRAIHCMVYTVGFAPVMFALGIREWEFLGCAAVLFVSHHIEDTYRPVMWWFKNIRRVPELRSRVDGYSDMARMGRYLKEGGPLGYILLISIDQIIHLCFLWVIVWAALN